MSESVVPRETRWSSSERIQISIQIDSLLDKGAIEKCAPESGQYISRIFLIPKSDGSQRLILNVKGLNEFVKTEHFKLEDWRVTRSLVSKDCYMATIDLKDAYQLVPVAQPFRKFLRFTFGGEFFEYTCLPYGLSSAPYVFAKVLKPVVGFLRRRGFLSVIYLDDILVFGDSFVQCQENVRETCVLLTELGFVLNDDKCVLFPYQRCKFLGFIFDSVKMSLELPEDKINSTLILIRKFKRIERCSIREFAAFVGTLGSRCPAVVYGGVYMKSFERAL